MSPMYQTFESQNVGALIQDSMLHLSPDNKYICTATSNHIFVIKINTNFLVTPMPNYFNTVFTLDISVSHGAQELARLMPLKLFIKRLPMDGLNRLVCDARVPSDNLFNDNVDMRKLEWCPDALQSQHSLLGALNSIGFLEILKCSPSGIKRVININNLWFHHCWKNYFKKYRMPRNYRQIADIYHNFCSLLYIDGFVWVPANQTVTSIETAGATTTLSSSVSVPTTETAGMSTTTSNSGSVLVCYHRLGIFTVWNIKEQKNQLREGVSDTSLMTDSPKGIAKKTPQKRPEKSNKPTQPSPANEFLYQATLVKVVTDYCTQPFSALSLFESEIPTGARVLNVDLIQPTEKATCISLCKCDGTIELLTLDLSDNAKIDANSDTNNTNQLTNDSNGSLQTGDSVKLTETLSEDAILNAEENDFQGFSKGNGVESEDVIVKFADSIENIVTNNGDVNKTINGHVDVSTNGELADVNEFSSEETSDKSLRKRKAVDANEQVQRKKSKRDENHVNNDENHIEIDARNIKADEECSENIIVSEPINKSDPTLTTAINNSDLTKTINIDSEKTATNDSDPNQTIAIDNSDPFPLATRQSIYNTPDRMFVSNLLISYDADQTILVFNKLYLIYCVVLNKHGHVIETHHSKIQTRMITTMAKFGRHKYLVGTFENKVLLVSIDRSKAGEKVTAGDQRIDGGLNVGNASKSNSVSPNENARGGSEEIGNSVKSNPINTSESIRDRDGSEAIGKSIGKNSINPPIEAKCDTLTICDRDKSIANDNGGGVTKSNRVSSSSFKNSAETLPQTNANITDSLTSIEVVGRAGRELSSTHNPIRIRKVFDLSNATHTVNGITSTTNQLLTLLSFRVKVKYESYLLSSRDPCIISLTTFYPVPNLLSRQLPTSRFYKLTDVIKYISLHNVSLTKLNALCVNNSDLRLRYFLLKLFRPQTTNRGEHSDEETDSCVQNTLDHLENEIYLTHIKRSVRRSSFTNEKSVLILFREWLKSTFPDLRKLLTCFPSEDYEESCTLCSEKIPSFVSAKYALCSNQHRVMRCSLSLVQCLGSYVQCEYCMAFAHKKYGGDERFRCIFCDAVFPL